jgi:hypothetical protein
VYTRGNEPLDRSLKRLECGGPAESGAAIRALIVAAGVSPRTPGTQLTAEEWYQISRQLTGRRRAASLPS